MIKNHQNFKENKKTATFVENFLQTNSHKQEKPDLEDKMGKSVKIISTLRLRVDGAKKNSAAEIPRKLDGGIKRNLRFLQKVKKHRKNFETALTPGIPSIPGIPAL